MDVEIIEKLMAAMETHHIQKLCVKENEFELTLEKPGAIVHAMPMTASMLPAAPMAPQPTLASPVAAPAASSGIHVTSPIVGTFYAAPSPNDPPFVKVGDKVSPDTVVCIIEAMKVMNEVKAGVTGEIEAILVKSGEPVEFGTKILRIKS